MVDHDPCDCCSEVVCCLLQLAGDLGVFGLRLDGLHYVFDGVSVGDRHPVRPCSVVDGEPDVVDQFIGEVLSWRAVMPRFTLVPELVVVCIFWVFYSYSSVKAYCHNSTYLHNSPPEWHLPLGWRFPESFVPPPPSFSWTVSSIILMENPRLPKLIKCFEVSKSLFTPIPQLKVINTKQVHCDMFTIMMWESAQLFSNVEV